MLKSATSKVEPEKGQEKEKTEAEPPDGGHNVQETKKKKKRKRDEESEPPKEKSRKKSDLPDPEEDSTLSEQAQKALSYAFTQVRHPKKWKFHKARQNWLIRNFWSDKTIPDPHVPLVLKYFARVQGGARQNIIKTCTSIISSQEEQGAQSTEKEGTDASTIQQQDEVKRKRATELLNVL
ncbi:hypothetical protein L218DRAFT_987558 [Marasmius fiardii PR-910]|nr:hypothetical protein L218DRAFT_987558 [Marasmius fiardii PR-910]